MGETIIIDLDEVEALCKPIRAERLQDKVSRLRAEVKRLRRDIYDEQVRRDEWKKMYYQAIAGTEVEQLQAAPERQRRLLHAERIRPEERDAVIAHFMRQVRAACEQAGLGKDHALHDYVPLLGGKIAILTREAKRLRDELSLTRVKLNRVCQDAQDQSDEVRELWLNPVETEGLQRQLKHAKSECDYWLKAHDELELKYGMEGVIERLATLDADEAALVNEETAALLDRLAKFATGWRPGLNQAAAAATARKLADRIREALDEH